MQVEMAAAGMAERHLAWCEEEAAGWVHCTALLYCTELSRCRLDPGTRLGFLLGHTGVLAVRAVMAETAGGWQVQVHVQVEQLEVKQLEV